MNSRATAESMRPAALAPVEVRGFAPADRVRWDEFVHRCVDATFFHRIGWKEIIEECFGHPTHFLLAERDAQIVGVLPLAEVKSFLFGHALVSLPFCAYGGVAADEDEAVSALHHLFSPRLLRYSAPRSRTLVVEFESPPQDPVRGWAG